MFEAFVTLFCSMAGVLIVIALLSSFFRSQGFKRILRALPKPKRLLQMWLARFQISRSTASALVVVIALLQILYTSGSIFTYYQELVAISFPPSLIALELKSMATTQFIQPVLSLLLGLSLFVCSVLRKSQPLILIVLVLIAACAGFKLSHQGEGNHEMSHAVGDECTSYPDTIAWFLVATIVCCCVLLNEPIKRFFYYLNLNTQR